MAETENLTLTSAWQLVAEGPGAVTLTAHVPDAFYAFREAEGAPADSLRGHELALRRDKSMQLETGTRVYARGRPGILAWSQDAT